MRAGSPPSFSPSSSRASSDRGGIRIGKLRAFRERSEREEEQGSNREEEETKKVSGSSIFFCPTHLPLFPSLPSTQIKLDVSPDVAHELVVTAFEGVS